MLSYGAMDAGESAWWVDWRASSIWEACSRLRQFKPPGMLFGRGAAKTERGFVGMLLESSASGKLVRGLCQFKPLRSRKGKGHGVDVWAWQLRASTSQGLLPDRGGMPAGPKASKGLSAEL